MLNIFNDFKRRWGPTICSLIPIEMWHRLLKIELIVPSWHIVSNNYLPHVSPLFNFRSEQQFKADLDFLCGFYTPVGLQEIISYLIGNGSLPNRCFIPTFDDGFREVYDIIAPILYTKGVPAVFFLTTSVIDNRELCFPQKKSLLIHALETQKSSSSSSSQEMSKQLRNAGINGPDLHLQIRSISYKQRQVLDKLDYFLNCNFKAYANSIKPYLSSEQIIKLLKDGFDIGAHSIDHPLYTELSLDEQLFQTLESMRFLARNYNYECQSFAFPFSDSGISHEFFRRAYSDSLLEITFGTGGILRHFFPRNLSRFSMERTNFPAKHILARQFGKALFRKYF